jgi:hypothetical protein
VETARVGTSALAQIFSKCNLSWLPKCKFFESSFLARRPKISTKLRLR